ncbi:MAG: 3,4-dihydroxy-2-butanone-4-phosphate synthase, partial [Alphaproteobacteria bacterium]
HGIKVATIADLIAHRLRCDRVVRLVAETQLHSRHGGEFRMMVYVNTVAYAEHVALVQGDVSTPEPVLVRMHALNVLDDVLGDSTSGRGGELQAAMRMIGQAGRGVVVLLREARPTGLSDQVSARLGKPPAEEKGVSRNLRQYGVGAQILLDLGIRNMILLSNTKRTIIGLDGFGLTVVDQRPIPQEEE